MAREAIVTLIIGKTGNLKNKRQTSEPAMGNYLPDLDENSAPVEQTEEQLTWIRIHRQEIRSGHRIIEREMHIGAQLLHYDHAEEQGLDTSSSKIHQLQIEVCNRQLKAPRGDFIAHSQRIVKLERAKPPGRRVREYLWQTQQHQRRTLWKVGRIFCQIRGGCCSRDCGCCKRSRRTIHDHSGRIQYLNCNRNCCCCVRHRTVVVSGSRSSLVAVSPTVSPTGEPPSDTIAGACVEMDGRPKIPFERLHT